MDTEKTFKTRFDGRIIECKALTSGQMTVVEAMSDIREIDPEIDPEGYAAMQARAKKGMHRLFRIAESRVGPVEWERIDDGIVMGTVDLADVINLLRKMIEAMVKQAAADQDKPIVLDTAE